VDSKWIEEAPWKNISLESYTVSKKKDGTAVFAQQDLNLTRLFQQSLTQHQRHHASEDNIERLFFRRRLSIAEWPLPGTPSRAIVHEIASHAAILGWRGVSQT